MSSLFQRSLMILFTLLVVSLPVHASMFVYPEELKAEYKVKYEAVMSNPESAWTRFELAMNLAYSGWIEEGWNQLKLVPTFDNNFAPKVIEKYTDLVEKEPNEWRHHFKLAFGYYFDDQKEKALSSFQKVVEMNPKQVWAMGFVALLKGEQKEYNQAIKICNEALKIDKYATAVHFVKAKALYEKGDVFGFLGESMTVIKLKGQQMKYRPKIPGEVVYQGL